MVEFRRSATDRRGVSEVISVVLMVAVTIVLAAMVGTILLDVVGDVDRNPLGAASVDFDSGDDKIHVTFSSAQSNDVRLNVTVTDANNTFETSKELNSVGDSTTFALSDGTEYTVTVVAVRAGDRAVVQHTSGTL